MTKITLAKIALSAALLSLASACSAQGFGGPPGGGGETVDIAIAESIEVGASDETAEAIVEAAQAFLATLSTEERKSALFAFDDNDKRGGWSNFPGGIFERDGIMRGDMSDEQNAALDALLNAVMSDKGAKNTHLQMAADDALVGQPGPPLDFGSHLYFAAFLGEPATDTPWMFQFGGHHLAINVTFVGAKASFSPMLTGGQPITVEFESETIFITREEVEASRAFLASLDASQKEAAVRGTSPARLLLGPGAHGTVVAPEGVQGADLNAEQKELLLSVVEARVSQFNARDAAAKMAAVRANVDETYFGWWGPQDAFGAAYFRITGPEIVMEYSPQRMGNGDPAEHAHNMYREPENDYGAAWISAD